MKPYPKTVSPEAIRMIRRSHGFAAQIARSGGFHRSVVTRILSGERPATRRFWGAVAQAHEEMRKEAEDQVIRSEIVRAEIREGDGV